MHESLLISAILLDIHRYNASIQPTNLTILAAFSMTEDYTLPLTIAIGLTLFLVQRTEAKSRGCVIWFMVLVVGGAITWFSYLRGVFDQAFSAFLIAGFFNLLFWVLIGRYNPVKSSDDIQVLGMDD
jgi:lysylphosphatidylglycerol synthetase-like protein (DUF2156 family)